MLAATPPDTSSQHQPTALAADSDASISGVAATATTWPTQTATTLPREGLQAVGYQTGAQR